MPDDDLESPPAQPRTIELPAVPQWAIELTSSVKIGFGEMRQRLDSLEGSDKNIADEVHRIRREIVDIRSENVRHDEAIQRLSIRTKGTDVRSSENDLEQAAQLGQERSAREALAVEHAETKRTVEAIKEKTVSIEKKTDTQTIMLGKITGLLDKPLVKKIGYAAGVLLLAAFTTATGYLARGNVQTPQPTIIQVAPVVTIDGGVR